MIKIFQLTVSRTVTSYQRFTSCKESRWFRGESQSNLFWKTWLIEIEQSYWSFAVVLNPTSQSNRQRPFDRGLLSFIHLQIFWHTQEDIRNTQFRFVLLNFSFLCQNTAACLKLKRLYSVRRIFVGFQFLYRSQIIEYFVGAPFSCNCSYLIT